MNNYHTKAVKPDVDITPAQRALSSRSHLVAKPKNLSAGSVEKGRDNQPLITRKGAERKGTNDVAHKTGTPCKTVETD